MVVISSFHHSGENEKSPLSTIEFNDERKKMKRRSRSDVATVVSSFHSNDATSSLSTISVERKKINRRSRWDVAYLGYRLVELPAEIRELIVEKLDLLGYYCFTAVCSTWRSIAFAARHDQRKPQFSFYSSLPQLPYLMFPSADDKEFHQLCFSLSHWKFFKLMLPEFGGGRCVGSSLGWLIMTSQFGNNYLLNPASRVQIELPCLGSQTNLIGSIDLEDKETLLWALSPFFIRKAILFSPPQVAAAATTTTAPKDNEAVNCLVVTIYKENALVFCRPGNQVWTAVEYDHPKLSDFEDIIFYSGKLYAVCRDFDLALLELGSHPRATKCNIPPPASCCELFSRGDRYFYLVECRGELLMILRHFKFPRYGYNLEAIDRDPISQTVGFQVFKLDPRIPCWVEVESLEDQMLFLGTSRAVSLSILDYPEFRGNCIFFADDSCFRSQNPQFCCDIGVFYLEDLSIKHFFPGYYHSSYSPPVWFTPNRW